MRTVLINCMSHLMNGNNPYAGAPGVVDAGHPENVDLSAAQVRALRTAVAGIDTAVGAWPAAAGRDGGEDRAPRSRDAGGSTRFARRVAGGALLVMVAVLVWFVWPSSPQRVTVTAEDGEVKRVDQVDRRRRHRDRCYHVQRDGYHERIDYDHHDRTGPTHWRQSNPLSDDSDPISATRSDPASAPDQW